MITKTITERIEEAANAWNMKDSYVHPTYSIKRIAFEEGMRQGMAMLLEELKSEKDKEYNQSGNSELWYGMNKCISILENR